MATVDDAVELLTSGEYKIGIGAREGEHFRMHPERIFEELRRRGADDDEEARQLALEALKQIGGYPKVLKIPRGNLRAREPVRELLFYVPVDQVD